MFLLAFSSANFETTRGSRGKANNHDTVLEGEFANKKARRNIILGVYMYTNLFPYSLQCVVTLSNMGGLFNYIAYTFVRRHHSKPDTRHSTRRSVLHNGATRAQSMKNASKHIHNSSDHIDNTPEHTTVSVISGATSA